MTPHEHAKRIVENYIQVGLGDPHQSTDHAVATAVAYLDLEQRLAAAEARSLDPTVAQQKLLDELAAARAEIVRLKTISVAQLVREAELSKNPGELEPRHLED